MQTLWRDGSDRNEDSSINRYEKFLTNRGGSIAVAENDVEEVEKEAAVLCSGLVESFIREFKLQLKLNLPIISAANTFSEKALSETIAKLHLSLSTALDAHAAKHSETFKLYSGSLALQVIDYYFDCYCNAIS